MTKDLLEKCIEGDRMSLVSFYDSYCKIIYNTCYRIVGNSDDAEDVMQESFIKIFCRLKNYRSNPESSVYALRRIAINGSIDMLRKRKRLFVELNDKLLVDDEQSIYDDPEIIYKVEMIKKGIAQLPDGYRLVITLKLIEDMDFADIAEELKVAQSTVRSQYMRGLIKLRKIIS